MPGSTSPSMTTTLVDTLTLVQDLLYSHWSLYICKIKVHLAMLTNYSPHSYGIHVNRLGEENANHLLYNWQYFDKRNRLCHNMVMEHFEVHKEALEDLIVDLNRVGPKIFSDIPDNHRIEPITLDDFALIDEMSGLNSFLDNFLNSHDVPETVKDRIRARMVRYSGDKPKEIALNELRMKIFGDSR